MEGASLKKLVNTGRRPYVHDGRTVYEWEQSLEEVNIFITAPPGAKADHLDCKITPTHVTLGIKGNTPYLNNDLAGVVVASESYWMMDNGEININLQKSKKGETWPSVFVGHGELDPISKQEVQKKLMLERFQEENPGFDFSNAEFNGAAPDPRSFLGGVKYS